MPARRRRPRRLIRTRGRRGIPRPSDGRSGVARKGRPSRQICGATRRVSAPFYSRPRAGDAPSRPGAFHQLLIVPAGESRPDCANSGAKHRSRPDVSRFSTARSRRGAPGGRAPPFGNSDSQAPPHHPPIAIDFGVAGAPVFATPARTRKRPSDARRAVGAICALYRAGRYVLYPGLYYRRGCAPC